MKPMLCYPVKLEEARLYFDPEEWIVEEKYDGIRAYIEEGRLYNRRGEEITRQFPEFEGIGKLGILSPNKQIDGEIVCGKTVGEVAGRAHMRDMFAIRLLAKKIPAKFIAFDFIDNEPLWARKERLSKLDGFAEWFIVVQSGVNLDAMWQEIQEFNETHEGEKREGVVLKRMDSSYQFGVRSKDWLKVKVFEEGTAVFTKLQEHPKGVRLETADGHSVNVNGEQAVEVKAAFDLAGAVTCDVQFMPSAPGSTAWRCPSFRGLR